MRGMCAYYEKIPETEHNGNYATIEICEAGKTYVETIASHFEFFSVRCNRHGNGYIPLFSCENIGQPQGNRFYFDSIIERVYNAVKACIERLDKFNDGFIKVKRISDYLNSPIVGTTLRGNKQTHEERVIFQHIHFIENYRWNFVCKRDDIDPAIRKSANRNLVAHISGYLDLFDQVAHFSTTRQECKETLRAKANTIKNSEYDDFITMIEM